MALAKMLFLYVHNCRLLYVLHAKIIIYIYIYIYRKNYRIARVKWVYIQSVISIK